jgi:hypothetical protein
MGRKQGPQELREDMFALTQVLRRLEKCVIDDDMHEQARRAVDRSAER